MTGSNGNGAGNGNGFQADGSLRREPGRSNGLAANPPEKGRTVLITGGAGYIGTVLTGRLLERGYNVRRWTAMPRGGHFAALEEPGLLAEDVRAFFRASRRIP